MKTPEFKPCPFCGKEATCKETSHGHGGCGLFTARFFVGCEECKIGFSHESQFRLKGAEVEFIYNGYETAKDRWNRRASDEKDMQNL